MAQKFIIDCRGIKLNLSARTHIMAILNVTPDSFSDGGQFFEPQKAIEHARQLERDGADIIDIGAESTRPGSDAVSVDAELKRLIPVVEGLLNNIKIPISIDTCKAHVAEEMLKRGVHLINDISGLQFDANMKHVVARYQVPVVIMHIKGTPKNMQLNPHYDNLLSEIYHYLQNSLQQGVAAGISRDKIIIDPGIGFGKRLADNYELIRRLKEFNTLSSPILIGPSRKSFIGNVLNVNVDERLEGTAAAVALGIANGAHIVRVHDVKEMKRVCIVSDLIVGKTSLEE